LVRKKFVARNVAPAPVKSAVRFATRLLLVMIISVFGSTLGAVPAPAAVPLPLQLVYRVSHSVIGDLGSYTCTVSSLANGSSEVRAQEHIDVKMLGIPLYRMDATDTELWQGDRLISFHGVTDNANGRVEVKGEARGDHFVITSPQGTLTTAATVHPADPCAANFAQSTTILHPDTGGLEQVRVSGGEPTSVVIGGAPIPARKYVMDGKTRYTVWIDSRNVPLMFIVDDNAGRAVFTLAKCASCNPPIARLGLE
jgi:hypothetical protein